MSLLSVIIPCYNESLSLQSLFRKAKYLTSYYDIELIFLDNGSSDDSWEIMQNFINLENIKCIKIPKNKGYGYGIKQGLENASSQYIGWTHADLQTDLFDLIRAYELIQNTKKTFLTIKGVRYARNLSENIISKGMSLISKLFFFPWNTFEINAQPSIYHKSIKSYLKNCPNDYNFDIYAYLISFYLKFDQIRFPVLFPSRRFGKSHWNINIFSKVSFILKTFLFIIKLSLKFRKF